MSECIPFLLRFTQRSHGSQRVRQKTRTCFGQFTVVVGISVSSVHSNTGYIQWDRRYLRPS